MCVSDARLDGLKGKHTLTMSVRDRTPEKKKGKEAGDVEEQSSERKSTRGPAGHELFSEESAFAPSLRQKRMKIAQGTRVSMLVKRAVSKIGRLVHRDDSRFVSTDTAQIADQSRPHSTPRHERHRVCQGETYSERAGCRHWGCWAVLEMTEGDPVLTGCGGRGFVTTRGSLGLTAALGFLVRVSVLCVS
jgi:hypothetical protein